MAGQQYDLYRNQYDPYAQYDPNGPYPSEYQDTDYYGNDPNGEYGQDPGKMRNRGDKDYYVSLEPCKRGSSCSMLDCADPKCTVRLVGNCYNKEIEFSLDKKMDSVINRFFCCLEEEGIVLDGVRVQGLPKRNCLKSCLEALCAPFAALHSVAARPQCFHCIQNCCMIRSSIINRRRRTLGGRCSTGSRRPSVCGRPKKLLKRWKSKCNPCRIARVCQGPRKEDCVLIKISPSLPKVGGVKCVKRSTGVGTDKFPELEIMLQGGKKKCKSKHRWCVCPHCCSSGKMKIVKCRSGKPKPCRERPKEKALEDMSEEELVDMLEKLEREHPEKIKRDGHYDPAALETMTEEELIEELRRLEKGSRDNRLSFSRRPRVNISLVESSRSLDGSSKLSESGSRLVLPKKDNVAIDSSESKRFQSEPTKYDAPLKVFPMHQTQNGGYPRVIVTSGSKAEGYHEPNNRGEKRSIETAMVLKEVLQMVKEILKNRTNSSDPTQTVEKNPDETSQQCPLTDEVNAIFRRSDICISESDASQPGTFDPKSQQLRNFASSKSVNVVARLKRSFSGKGSFRKEPPGEGQNELFEKLRIYVETDKKEESAEFLPIELTEKKGSTHLNTLII